MSRGGRLTAAALAGALLVSGVAGCARFGTQPVQVAPPAVAGDCVVGSWQQTEGWQRITAETVVVEIRLVQGGRRYEIKPDGTASLRYADPTKWQNGDTSPSVVFQYGGSATLTYTAVDGKWNQTADTTASTSQLFYNDKPNDLQTGGPDRTASATYRCDDSTLIITSDDQRQVYRRL